MPRSLDGRDHSTRFAASARRKPNEGSEPLLLFVEDFTPYSIVRGEEARVIFGVLSVDFQDDLFPSMEQVGHSRIGRTDHG